MKVTIESCDIEARSTSIAQLDIIAVIPVYKQPGFLAEAIESVLTQRGKYQVGCVIVDDGCPFHQTQATARAFATNYPDKIVYLRRANGGLSAARNTGVEFVLQALPNCRSIYLLDADNRLRPDFLNCAQDMLDTSSLEIGWVYPDVDCFGLAENYSARGDYSYFMHLLENYCDAGSLVRRSVFEAGLRYDESMRDGFEGWDFWLRAAQKSFRGKYLISSGFLYRKRAESMLVNSERNRTTILGAMRARYGKHLNVRALACIEAAEIPRFAVYVLDEGIVRYGLDPVIEPSRTETCHLARKRFVEGQRAPGSVHFPAFCCFANSSVVDLLRRVGLLRNLFYHAQIALRDAHLVAVTITWASKEEIAQTLEPVPAPGSIARAAVLMFTLTSLMGEVASDKTSDWFDSIISDEPRPRLAHISLRLPETLRQELPLSALGMLAEVDNLRASTATRSALKVDWRGEWRRSRTQAYQAYSDLAGCGAILPYLGSADKRDIGFLLPHFDFGGVENVVFNYAVIMRKMGWRPHLFITEANYIRLPDNIFNVFETINFFVDEGVEGSAGAESYFGASVPAFSFWRDTKDAIGLLATMNIVLNTHTLGGHALMQAIRRQGVRTYLGLHMVEKNRLGQFLGNPHIALAYENAYDGFVVISKKLQDWCMGQGVPENKIYRVPNAPSYKTDPERAFAAMRRRSDRKNGRVRVLYLGRLTQQKGLERLRDIVLGTLGSVFEWRLVGSAVLNDSAVDLNLTGVPVEALARSGDQLDELYAWADVVVLPSRYEGVPLTILEAQRFGCVVIATDIGAVSEVIQHGMDGFLVKATQSEFHIVSSFISQLFALADQCDTMLRVGNAAALRVGHSDWDINMQPWIHHLEESLVEVQGF